MHVRLILFLFQNLKTTPTLIQAKRWDKNNKIPVRVSKNKLIPTVPIIKRGPELLVKARSLSPSSFVQIPFCLKLVTILAPIGYPLIIPIINAKAPTPGTLKIGLINLFKTFPKTSMMPV